jgi:hypothetical protein
MLAAVVLMAPDTSSVALKKASTSAMPDTANLPLRKASLSHVRPHCSARSPASQPCVAVSETPAMRPPAINPKDPIRFVIMIFTCSLPKLCDELVGGFHGILAALLRTRARPSQTVEMVP